MKITFALLLSFMFLCCGQKKQTRKEMPAATEKAIAWPQWLSFGEQHEHVKHIVLVSGDEEYRSEEALPQLAKILSDRHGFKCTVLFAQDPKEPGIVNPNYLKNIPGLELLQDADMLVLFTRFRALPDVQMQYIDDYLKSGKPVMGIRTATHAFNFAKDSLSNYKHYGNYYEGEKTAWHGGFGQLVLGENWVNHHGHHKHQSTHGIIAEGALKTGLVNGITDGDVWGPSDVYGVRLPLSGDAQPIILGQVMERDGEFDENDIFYGMKPTDGTPATVNENGLMLNDPMIPVTWTKSYQLPGGKKGKAFTTTIGVATDMLIEGTRRLLVNGIYWGLDMEIPEKADVRLVGDYSPTVFEFRDDAYWKQRQMTVQSLN